MRMRFNMLYRILLVFIVCVLLLTGCNQTSGDAGSENVETHLEYGFGSSGGSGNAMNPVRIAYRSDKTEFDIDDVVISFYYGYDMGKQSAEYYIQKENASYPYFELYFYGKDIDPILIKRVEENLISEKYRVSYDSGKADFKYSEEIRIPKELFKAETGWISFRIYGENEYDSFGYTRRSFVEFYYKVMGEKVTLSTKPFE